MAFQPDDALITEGEKLIQRRVVPVTATSAAAGNTVTFEHPDLSPPPGRHWLTDRATIFAPGAATQTLTIFFYIGQVANLFIEDYAEIEVGAANRDIYAIAEWGPPLWVPRGSALRVRITGVQNSVSCQMILKTREMTDVPERTKIPGPSGAAVLEGAGGAVGR